MSDAGGRIPVNGVIAVFSATASVALPDSLQIANGVYLPTDYESVTMRWRLETGIATPSAPARTPKILVVSPSQGVQPQTAKVLCLLGRYERGRKRRQIQPSSPYSGLFVNLGTSRRDPAPVNMPRIRTDSLQVGMVVAGDVKNIDGMLLIPAGCTLSERQINILQAWGVAEIQVEAGSSVQDTDPLARLSLEAVEKMRTELKARFWEVEETNPVFAQLSKALLHRQALRGGAK